MFFVTKTHLGGNCILLCGSVDVVSDLASSCEYLSVDKTCTAFNDDLKAKSSRQLKCKNSQESICCYLCVFRLDCVISCKYLGRSESCVELKSVSEDVCVDDKVVVDDGGSLQFESVPVAFCFSCNVAMVWAKTKFVVDTWCGGNQASFGCVDKLLPVTVFLCPTCGKVEFKANLGKEN